MKESYRKGVASHPGSESRVPSRKVAIEALTGEDAGRVLSCEIIAVGVPTSTSMAEGNIGGYVVASIRWTLRSLRPRHALKLRAREPGDPIDTHRAVCGGPAGESH